MAIPLSVEKAYSDRYQAFVTYILHIPSLRVLRPVRALIDSGSPFTVISPMDALASQLPLSHWQKGEILSIAGSKFFRHRIENATMNFRDDKDAVVSFNRYVDVLVPTKLNKATLDEVDDIPSIIGNDFLEELKLTFFSPGTQTGCLQ